MKGSPWSTAALAALVLTGLAYLGVGVWRPGRLESSGEEMGAGKSILAEVKSRAEAFRKSRQESGQKGLLMEKWETGESGHRVFVPATLVYLPGNAEPVQALDRNMKTEDGLEIGWKMKYGFDPADPNVRDQDPDGDGFANWEEHDAVPPTNPLVKEDSPPKERKLRVRRAEPLPLTITFPEKSGGTFAIRFQAGKKRQEFRGRPGDRFWILAGPDLMDIFSDEKTWQSACLKAKEAGRGGHGIPLQFDSYREKIEKIRDVSAGGVEIEVDNSEMILVRNDALQTRETLPFSSPQKSHALVWDVGNVVLGYPGSETGDLGPFRIGEIFSFEGKEFALIGREDRKIQLRDVQDPEKKAFWVLPENSPAQP